MSAKLAKFMPVLSACLLVVSCTLLTALGNKPWGWVLLGLCPISLIGQKQKFIRDMSLLILAMILVGLTPVNTNLDAPHLVIMSVGLIAAAALPYFISRYIYKDRAIRFKLNPKRLWNKKDIFYLAIWLLLSYFILPIYFATTGAHANWTVEPSFHSLSLLFYGTNSVGAWDEFFFICTVLAILRRHLPFWLANCLQAIMFVSFLYELGFTGWAFVPLYIFALLQGTIFRRTESLLYVLVVHLSIDFILYLALIHAHYPQFVPIFITG